MIPKRIEQFFQIITQKETEDGSLIEGALKCCDSNDFEIRIVGKVETNFIHRLSLRPNNNQMVVTAVCKKCGNIIEAFNLNCDGYDHCCHSRVAVPMTKTINCKQCESESFSVKIKYEYPDEHELEELRGPFKNNAYTWIWMTLDCNKCGRHYPRFVDCETA